MKNPHFVRIQKILGPLVRFLFPITLEGAENLPDDRPVMLCANHSSAWDPILFVAAIWTGYPLRIMAKKQLLRIPILGSILKAIGVFAVDRGNSDILAVKTAIQSLKQGWNLLIFPEGTRVKNPGQAEVKGGAAMIAIRSGVQMLIFLAGLQSISPAIYESCYMEGASAWETFWKITFPYISPMILSNLVYTVIDAFVSTDNVVMEYVLAQSRNWEYGYSAALAWIYFAIVGACLGIICVIINRFVYYEND